MTHAETAKRVGVSLSELNDLLKGKASNGLAKRLGIAPSDIESFIRGSASNGMTKRLGLNAAGAARELAKAAGPAGATGIILGLLFH